MPSWVPMTAQDSYAVPATIVTSPLQLKKTSCPVDGTNRETWTEKERDRASRAIEAEDLPHMERLVTSIP